MFGKFEKKDHCRKLVSSRRMKCKVSSTICSDLCCDLSLTLNERSKVKSDTDKRFTEYGFLQVECTLQISRTNNKQDRDT